MELFGRRDGGYIIGPLWNWLRMDCSAIALPDGALWYKLKYFHYSTKVLVI
jgi:hypothetical protein